MKVIQHVNHDIKNNEFKTIPTNNSSKVWGRSVYVYSYCIEYSQRLNQKELLKNIKNSFNFVNHNSDYSYNFVLSDFYVKDKMVFLDIAYTSNEATLEYLQDLAKIKKAPKE
ncbi:hypothetical protein [Apilactobacillus xinyiensis]|uniref:Uncharacterized protein n=1 Tax=Apilactobacillus xinyiensis TaxID=2841032 RepID=A0ABT0I1Y9_9LACO|nr:hypothetical protein [Apilactobacillus xinyiensis]MCK8624727.1 hypothetical protein [Apilactobacillus xinyiensis]MCL0318842.1 hypothetical protein [Apilactobacillus xinyiensis]MCL0329916.1 hypothetical protein [Apilactobacillus xinyiensis]